MAQKFKVGDLVVLKSGGPVMTVTNVIGDTCNTSWFSGKKSESARFNQNALDPAPAADKKKD